MKLLFNVEYQTTFGEELVLNILPADDAAKVSQHKMTTLDGLHWFCELTKTVKPGTFIDYYYSLMRGDEEVRHEWLVEPHRLECAAQKGARYTVADIVAQSFVRVDRQTLRKLPASGDILFTIRIYLDPLAVLIRHPDRARIAAGFATQLGELDDAQLDYKGLIADRDRLVAYLEAMSRS